MKNLVFLMYFSVISFSCTNVIAATLFEHVNLATMIETSTTSLDLLKELPGYGSDLQTKWDGNFDENSWSLKGSGNLGNKSISMQYTGSLSGTFGNNLEINYTGIGLVGSDTFEVNGTTTWIFDKGANGYTNMLYNDQISLPWWKWIVKGIELVASGIAGAVNPGLGAGVSIAASTLSNVIIGTPANPPPTPPTPTPPPKYPPEIASTTEYYSYENSLISNNFGDRTIFLGNVLDKSVHGTISTVPIPGAVWLFGSGLIGLLSFNRRKK